MIPLYVQNENLRGTAGLPQKNPIYFIRKAIGRSPANVYSVIVLNADGSLPSDFLPSLTYLHTAIEPDNAYDVEQAAIQGMYDFQVEPNAERDGSLAGAPRRLQAVITLEGFIRGSNFKDLQRKAKFMNLNFDPVMNYMEGSSTFGVTVTPSWQTFNNVGFGVLAWYDDSAFNEPWRIESDGVQAEDPFLEEPYARLNRFMFVRSIERPVQIDNKFSDMSVPFRVQLLAIDPTTHELIAPTAFHSSEGAHHTLDESSNGKTMPDASVSAEVFITPTYLWGFTGPGWREVLQAGPGEES